MTVCPCRMFVFVDEDIDDGKGMMTYVANTIKM
jgi:hypothetical protein